jgi:four helix bundle protein
MAGVRSHTDLIAWRLAHELKLQVYALIEAPALSRHPDLREQLRRAAANAPRNIAEGFGRYLPGDFIRYLRFANGEFKEILDALQDARDRRCLDADELLRLQRLCKRASKATTNFITYLKTATPPNEPPRRRRHPQPPRATTLAHPTQRSQASRSSQTSEPSTRSEDSERRERREPSEPSEPAEPPEPPEPPEPRTPRTKPPAPPEPPEPPEPWEPMD